MPPFPSQLVTTSALGDTEHIEEICNRIPLWLCYVTTQKIAAALVWSLLQTLGVGTNIIFPVYHSFLDQKMIDCYNTYGIMKN